MKILTFAIAIFFISGCQTTQWDGTGEFPGGYTLAASNYAVSGNSDVLVVYIGASNCPPCIFFMNQDYPHWIKSDEYRHVNYREMEFKTYQDTSSDNVWPNDLKWLKNATYTREGAPRWIVLIDGLIVSNEMSWYGETFPLIKNLVQRKLAS
jgi:hypothetical protein